MEWEKKIFGMIPKEEWLNVGFNVTRPNDPVDSLFADERTNNLVAKWQSIAAEFQIPVMAQFHGFDTEAKTTFRVPVDTHNIEKGLIKVKINQSERLRALTRAGVQNDEMFDYVMNDGIRLADQVVTRSKVAKNEVMFSGKMTIKENDLDLTVDYGVPAENTAFVLDLSEDANVPAQIQGIVNAALEQGKTITGMLTSRKNLTKIRSNAAIQKAINGSIGAGALVRAEALNAYLESEFGISVVLTNDLTYGADAVIGPDGRPSITKARYYPEDKVTFFSTTPAGRLGIGLWGDPPEADAPDMLSNTNASGQSPFVYIHQWMTDDPAVLWTKASGLFIPVLYDPQSLFIATVGGEGAGLTVAPADADFDLWGTPVSSVQENLMVGTDKILGTLKNLTTGQLVTDWGAGNFLALKYGGGAFDGAKHIYVGVDPSAGSGLVDIIADPDRVSVTKINSTAQKFKVIIDYGAYTDTKVFDLSGLTLANS